LTTYIHQLPTWPRFSWSQETLASSLASIRHKQGRLIGHLQALGFSIRAEAVLETLTLDVLKSSEIEGEILNPEQVRSSLARKLGIEIAGAPPTDRHVEGIVTMMLDATQHFDKPLTAQRLFKWRAALFPTGRSGMYDIVAGAWRNDARGPMQVVSGPPGRERVHYEAPAAERLDSEMTSFIDWTNRSEATDPVLRSAIAHLWFVTIHPFDDGNGRIARAIADWLLAQSENSPQRFYSMSAQIRLERNTYYDVLERTQVGTLDVTLWLEWFLQCLSRAIDATETTLASVLRKARFWDKRRTAQLNDRQRLMLNMLLDGFKGKLTSSKWAKLTKCSQDTAHRDIQDLIEQGVLAKDPAGGRSTSYSLLELAFPGEGR
jgi:Fic family protein